RWVHDHAAGWRLVPVRGLEQLIRRLLFEAHRDCHGDREEPGAVPRRAVAPCLLALRALRGGSPLPQVPAPARAGLRRVRAGRAGGGRRGLAGDSAAAAALRAVTMNADKARAMLRSWYTITPSARFLAPISPRYVTPA